MELALLTLSPLDLTLYLGRILKMAPSEVSSHTLTCVETMTLIMLITAPIIIINTYKQSIAFCFRSFRANSDIFLWSNVLKLLMEWIVLCEAIIIYIFTNLNAIAIDNVCTKPLILFCIIFNIFFLNSFLLNHKIILFNVIIVYASP